MPRLFPVHLKALEFDSFKVACPTISGFGSRSSRLGTRCGYNLNAEQLPGEAAMIDFAIEPEFQAKLDWIMDFLKRECEPLDMLAEQGQSA